MANIIATTRIRSTREQHIARMRETQDFLADGMHPSVVEERISRDHGCSRRQARRYVRAFRRLGSRLAAEDALTIEELLGVLLKRSIDCIKGEEPDWKASAKFLEQYARMRGWLDRKSTVTVQGTIGLQPLPALAGASDEEIALLAQYHDARARRMAEAVAPAGTLALTPAVTPTE